MIVLSIKYKANKLKIFLDINPCYTYTFNTCRMYNGYPNNAAIYRTSITSDVLLTCD